MKSQKTLLGLVGFQHLRGEKSEIFSGKIRDKSTGEKHRANFVFEDEDFKIFVNGQSFAEGNGEDNFRHSFQILNRRASLVVPKKRRS